MKAKSILGWLIVVVCVLALWGTYSYSDIPLIQRYAPNFINEQGMETLEELGTKPDIFTGGKVQYLVRTEWDNLLTFWVYEHRGELVITGVEYPSEKQELLFCMFD